MLAMEPIKKKKPDAYGKALLVSDLLSDHPFPSFDEGTFEDADIIAGSGILDDGDDDE